MYFVVVVLAYMLGSIPSAYIAGRLSKGKDIRQMGDGNMGAQNAFRQLNPAIGIAVGIIDAVKGALAVLIATAANMPQVTILLAGAAAVIGHNWPIFVGFRGGRGESTTIGVLAVIVFWPMLIAGSLAIAVLVTRKSVIQASVAMFVALPLLCWSFGVPGLLVSYGIFLPSLIGATHVFKTRQRLEVKGETS
ncbi:MAG: glycerol-3-phosphate acyltransferase [Dehalococcoidales bacterium]|nr:glycerol-3-phosphate acyltransferase [Dehalococcoidales bacterium]